MSRAAVGLDALPDVPHGIGAARDRMAGKQEEGDDHHQRDEGRSTVPRHERHSGW